jgi:outer membrane receptor protein involved in Fe transport
MNNRSRTISRLFAGASLALIGSLTGGVALAQEANSAPAHGGTTVSGVTVNAEVVTTAPVAPPLKATFSESTITSDVIRNLSPAPMVTVQTMLNDQPSIFAYTNGPLGVQTDINFRAFNSGQFAETYDGIALNDLFNSSVTGQADNQNNVLLLPSNVDSVQIYRGINNPSVNSYNSLGGTIDYLPRQPDKTAGALVGASYGSFDTKEVHATLNTGDLDGVRQLLALSDASSDGWAAHTSDRNANVFYSGAYDAANGDHLGLMVVYNHNDGHTPFQMPVALLQQDGKFYQWPTSVAYENDRDSNWLGILDFRAQLAPNVSFDSKFFGGFNDYYRTSYANPADSWSPTQPYELPNQAETYDYWIYNPNGPYYNPKKTFGSNPLGNDYHFYGYRTWGAGYTPTLTIDLPHNNVIVGGNITYGELYSREYWYGAYDMPMTVDYNDAWDEHDQRLFASVYIQDEIDLFDKRLSLTPGVKYLFAHTSDTDAVGFFYPYGGSVGNDASFIAPTLGVNYKVTDQFAVYAAFGENIKFPDITAYYNGIPGTTAATPPAIPPVTVQPEHVNDYELGLRYQQDGLSGSLAFYREDFTHTFIDAFNPSTYLTVVSNGGGSRYQGVELQVLDDFGAQPWGDLKATVSFAYNEANFTSTFQSDYVGGSNSNADVTVTKGEPLADVPNILFSAGLDWTYEGWRLDLAGRYVGSQYTDNTSSGTPSNTKIAGYAVIDIGVSKLIQFHGLDGRPSSIKLSLNVNNLLNQYYYNQAYTQQDYNNNNYLLASPGAPRSVIGAIEMAF